MIIRIATEGQYELDGERLNEQLNELDNAAVAACDGGSESEFRESYGRLLEFVRSNGQPVADDVLGGLRSDSAATGRDARGGQGGVHRRGILPG